MVFNKAMMMVLKKKTKNDLKCDLILSYVSLLAFIFFFMEFLLFERNIQGSLKMAIAAVFFLMWYNAYLLTVRDLEIIKNTESDTDET